MLLEHSASCGGIGRLEHGWARGDRGERIADHVRHDESQHGSRRGRASQAAALDLRERFSDLIDVADGSPGVEERLIQSTDLIQVHLRRQNLKHGRAATGDQHQDPILRLTVLKHLSRYLTGSQAPFVGERMGTFYNLYSPGQVDAGAGRDDGDARRQGLAEQIDGGAGQGRCGLADGDKE